MTPLEQFTALIEEYARQIRCGFCGAPVGEPCHVYGRPDQRSQRTHSPRLAHSSAFWEAWRLGKAHALDRVAREAS